MNNLSKKRSHISGLRECRAVTISAAILLSSATQLFAESDHGSSAHEDHREVGAHVHGAAQLNVAVDEGTLIAEFISPAASIVGFEREAASVEEVTAVEDAVAALKTQERLFSFSGTDCSPTSIAVEAEGLLEEVDEEAHLEEEHAEDEHAEDGHAEFEAMYQFECVHPSDLSSIELGFFEVWPEIEEIEVIFLSEENQMAFELTASSPVIEVK
jgi:uncharacterized protein DUF2796